MATYRFIKQDDHDLPCQNCGITPSVTVGWPRVPYHLCKECLYKQVSDSLMIATIVYECTDCHEDVYSGTGPVYCQKCAKAQSSGKASQSSCCTHCGADLTCTSCEMPECGCGATLTCPDCSDRNTTCANCGEEFTCLECDGHDCNDNADMECHEYHCYEERSEYCSMHAVENYGEGNTNRCDECDDDGRVLCSTCAGNEWNEVLCHICNQEMDFSETTCEACARKAKAADQVVSFVGKDAYRVHISQD